MAQCGRIHTLPTQRFSQLASPPRSSAKVRSAAVGPAHPARRTSLSSMSTPAERVSWAPGPQTTLRVREMTVYLHLFIGAFIQRQHEIIPWQEHEVE